MNTHTPEKTPRSHQQALGNGIQRLRLAKNLPQAEAAAQAGVSERAWRNLENGRGSTIETVLRALDTLDALSLLDGLLTSRSEEGINQKRPRRASRSRQEKQPLLPHI